MKRSVLESVEPLRARGAEGPTTKMGRCDTMLCGAPGGCKGMLDESGPDTCKDCEAS